MSQIVFDSPEHILTMVGNSPVSGNIDGKDAHLFLHLTTEPDFDLLLYEEHEILSRHPYIGCYYGHGIFILDDNSELGFRKLSEVNEKPIEKKPDDPQSLILEKPDEEKPKENTDVEVPTAKKKRNRKKKKKIGIEDSQSLILEKPAEEKPKENTDVEVPTAKKKRNRKKKKKIGIEDSQSLILEKPDDEKPKEKTDVEGPTAKKKRKRKKKMKTGIDDPQAPKDEEILDEEKPDDPQSPKYVEKPDEEIADYVEKNLTASKEGEEEEGGSWDKSDIDQEMVVLRYYNALQEALDNKTKASPEKQFFHQRAFKKELEMAIKISENFLRTPTPEQNPIVVQDNLNLFQELFGKLNLSDLKDEEEEEEEEEEEGEALNAAEEKDFIEKAKELMVEGIQALDNYCQEDYENKSKPFPEKKFVHKTTFKLILFPVIDAVTKLLKITKIKSEQVMYKDLLNTFWIINTALSKDEEKVDNDVLPKELLKENAHNQAKKQRWVKGKDQETVTDVDDVKIADVANVDGKKIDDADDVKIADVANVDGKKVDDVDDVDGKKVDDADDENVGDGEKVSNIDEGNVADHDANKVADGDAEKERGESKTEAAYIFVLGFERELPRDIKPRSDKYRFRKSMDCVEYIIKALMFIHKLKFVHTGLNRSDGFIFLPGIDMVKLSFGYIRRLASEGEIPANWREFSVFLKNFFEKTDANRDRLPNIFSAALERRLRAYEKELEDFLLRLSDGEIIPNQPFRWDSRKRMDFVRDLYEFSEPASKPARHALIDAIKECVIKVVSKGGGEAILGKSGKHWCLLPPEVRMGINKYQNHHHFIKVIRNNYVHDYTSHGTGSDKGVDVLLDLFLYWGKDLATGMDLCLSFYFPNLFMELYKVAKSMIVLSVEEVKQGEIKYASKGFARYLDPTHVG